MSSYSLAQLSDFVLLRDLESLVARDRTTTAALLAHVAEVDARKLYLPAAYPSMYAYCVGKLRLSEEAAFKRIHAARAARRFPRIFCAIADGRLHLTAVIILAPHLIESTSDELLDAAEFKTKPEIERMLAERFPRPDLPTELRMLVAPALIMTNAQHAPERVSDNVRTVLCATGATVTSEPVLVSPTMLQEPRSRVTPLSPQRFALQVTIDEETHEMIRRAQELLGHRLPKGDLASVLKHALRELILHLEKQKFAATTQPQAQRRPTNSERHVPAAVKREVWVRDGGRCTFVSEAGRRCPSSTRLEFDHIDEVARGGEATVGNLRLRCRLCRYRHKRHYAASGFMPRWCGVAGVGQDKRGRGC